MYFHLIRDLKISQELLEVIGKMRDPDRVITSRDVMTRMQLNELLRTVQKPNK